MRTEGFLIIAGMPSKGQRFIATRVVSGDDVDACVADSEVLRGD